jgi:hypothetical protein
MSALERVLRLSLLLIALVFLILGLSAGLMRLGWIPSWTQPKLVPDHGPLMICGFLGTLVSLERAIALGRRWGYAAPLMVGVGTLGFVTGVSVESAMFLIALGSLALVFIFVAVLLMQPALHSATMGLGAVAWLVGNILWFVRIPIPPMTHWWIAFLVLTIAGERLELNRLLKPSRHGKSAFGVGLSLFVTGLICAAFRPELGHRIAGVGMLTLAWWLARFDVARFTVHRAGLPRFISVCLFAGYFWLGMGGLIWALAAPLGAAGGFSFFAYDAMLHSIFLGFVFSMIFAHAPIVFPAVTGRPLVFHPGSYAHVFLLQLSLIARMVGDFVGSFSMLREAGLTNVFAIILFLANNAWGMITERRK